jgi:uncharacterized integral membrane protein
MAASFVEAMRFLCIPWCIAHAMAEFFSFMTSDTTIFNVAVHNWLLALGGVVVIWATVVFKDL